MDSDAAPAAVPAATLRSPLFPSGGTASFPFYISQTALAVVVLLFLGLLSFSIYLFALSGTRHERLNGGSHWMAAISFAAAAKCTVQLGHRLRKMRRTYTSVTTFLSVDRSGRSQHGTQSAQRSQLAGVVLTSFGWLLSSLCRRLGADGNHPIHRPRRECVFARLIRLLQSLATSNVRRNHSDAKLF